MSTVPTTTKLQSVFRGAELAEKRARAVDSFQNFAAKLGVGPRGTPAGDINLLSQGDYTFNLVTRNRILLEAAYRGSWIIGQVIDTIAEDMTRAGIDITTNKGADDIETFQTAMSRLQIWESLARLTKWGRLYGGAIAVVQLEGQKLETPLDLDTVAKEQFQGLTVYDRWQLNPDLTDLIDSGPEMGLPKYYYIVLGANLNDPGMDPSTGQHTTQNNGQVKVHHSRCIRYIGIELPFWQAITEMMWGESVLERMWDRLIMFDDASLATGNLMNTARLRGVGIEGLREILAAGGDAQKGLEAQFEMMRDLQSNDGLTLTDKEDVLTTTNYTFAGVSDVLTQFGQQVSGACSPCIPLVRLFGQSPAGMNATGEADIRLYYDGIKAQQKSRYTRAIEMILKIMWRSETGKPIPDDVTFEFTPLWQMTAVDQATVSKTNTDTIIEAHQEGLVSTQVAMKELKQSSGDSGLFSNITDEDINEAESEAPPTLPDGPPDQNNGPSTGEPGAGPTTPKKTKDSAMKKVKRWLRG